MDAKGTLSRRNSAVGERSVPAKYAVARAGRVRLELLDVSGLVVATLANRFHAPGRHVTVWVGAGGSLLGLYFIRLVAPDQATVRKLAIIE